MTGTLPAQTELLVVGAGPGGYVAAIRAAQHGLDVVLADAEGVGGTCLNHGCIPSKALITAADRVHETGQATEMGIYGDPYVDVNELFQWTDDVVSDLTTGVSDLCRANGVTIVEGTVTFDTETTAQIATGEDSATISFDQAVIATGSRPLTVDGFDPGDEPIVDARQALSLSEIPPRLVVVGAGYIGLELGTAFRKLGSAVTVIEMRDRALPEYDPQIATVVEGRAQTLGIDLAFGQAVTGWTQHADGVSVTAVTDDGDEHVYEGDTVLVAVGREPVTDTVGLDALGIEPNADGFIPTDASGQTPCDSVYAVGDVAGGPMLAHKASMEGAVAANDIAGTPVTDDDRVIPAVIFTDPEIATVGATEAEVRDRGQIPAVGRFPLSASGRAKTLGDEDGFIELVADQDTGVLLGGTIVGADAAELIGELTLAIQTELTVGDLATTVHPHPTISEAVMEAAEGVFGSPIHWFDDN